MMERLCELWRRGLDRLFGAPQAYRIEHVEEPPVGAARGVLYLIGEGDDPWFAAMRCPCGCGRRHEMNLLPDDHPAWRLEFDRMGAPSLHPSIWLKTGCESHFFLRRGKVEWAYSTAER